MRYSAFISYNYRDVRWARWLHRGLETYRVPAHLLGRQGRFGPITARLPPVFRDREELSASDDLGAAIRQALADAEMLIVLCSPNAVQSRWVNEEIRAFVALGRRDRIRCLIVDGEPHAADPARECLPPALFEGSSSEPLAADIRKGQDPRSSAKLKLIAGILDLPYDELRQREAARQRQRLMLIASASTIGFVAMAGLAVSAVLSRNEAVAQRKLADDRAVTAERTVEFVKSMFEVSDPSEARGQTITAREVLDQGASRITTSLKEEPLVQAELGITLGEVYGSLGLYKKGDALLDWAGTVAPGQASVKVRQLLGSADSKRRMGEYALAETLYQRGIAIAREPGGPRADLLSRLLVGLGEAQTAQDKFAAADGSIREALRLDQSRWGAEHRDVARDLEALGLNALYANRFGDARPLFLRALAIRRKLEGPMSPSVADNLNNLATVAYMQGDPVLAETYYIANLQADEKVLGPRHPDLAVTLNNIGRLQLERRAFAAARVSLARAVAISLPERGALHDEMAFQFANLALAEQGLDKLQPAEAHFQQALAAGHRHKHRNVGPILVDLANVHCQSHRTESGLALLAEAVPLMRLDYPDDPWRMAWAWNVKGECLIRAGNAGAGAQAIRDSATPVLRRWPQGSYYAAEIARRLVLAAAADKAPAGQRR